MIFTCIGAITLIRDACLWHVSFRPTRQVLKFFLGQLMDFSEGLKQFLCALKPLRGEFPDDSRSI